MFAFSEQFDTLAGDGLTLCITEKYPGDDVLLPFYFYDIYAGSVPVGKISIRIGDNFHSYYNGHIGYEVDEPYRGHRYALRSIALVLPVARYHGMTRVLITCGESNVASRRTAELAGGRLLEIAAVPRDWFAWYEGIEPHCIYAVKL